MAETDHRFHRVSPRFTELKETVSISHILDILHVKSPSGSSKNLSPSLEVDWKDWNKLQEWTEPVPSAAPPTSQSVSIPPADAPNAATVAVLVSWTQAPMMRVCEQNKLVWVKVGQPHFFILSVVDFFNNAPFCMSPVHALSVFWKCSLLFTLSEMWQRL